MSLFRTSAIVPTNWILLATQERMFMMSTMAFLMLQSFLHLLSIITLPAVLQ